ncbi:MAG TPA: hypothetical protein EYP59_11790, partial [Thiotrichaceae bacterium]|nr:hypothetical protein [Thiotrichaceae bacterium]
MGTLLLDFVFFANSFATFNSFISDIGKIVMKCFNFPIDNLKKEWVNQFPPPLLARVLRVIWQSLRLPFSLFHFRPSGLRVFGVALSRREHKITRLYEQRTLIRCSGLALARWIGWAIILVTSCSFAELDLRMVQDINWDQWDRTFVDERVSFFSGMTPFNNSLIYLADDGIHGRELWELNTDDQVAHIVSDIFAGPGNSNPDHFIVFNDVIYFSAGELTHGEEIWGYDGTTTYLVADLNPGTGSSSPTNFIIFKGLLYFTTTYTGAYDTLWSFDGVSSPSIVSYTNGMHLRLGIAGVYNDLLYFSASLDGDDLFNQQLWAFDGTTNPTLVMDVIGSNGFTVFHNKLFFNASTIDFGNELWVIDQENPPQMVFDINPGSDSSAPGGFTEYNDKLYFSASNMEGDTDGSFDRELWVYDDISNPLLVMDIYPGSQGSHPSNLAVFDNKLFFSAREGDAQLVLPWVHDGVNTSKVDLDPFGYGFNYASYYLHTPYGMIVFDNKLFFGATTHWHGRELMVYGDLEPKAANPITFPSPGEKTYGDAPFTVTATVDSGLLQVDFSAYPMAVCTANNDIVTIHTPGNCYIRAYSPGNAYFQPSHSEQSILINGTMPSSITFPNPGSKTYGDVPFTLNASADSGLPVSYSSSTTSICTVSDDTVTIVSTGDCTITASQVGNATYEAAIDVSQTFTIGLLSSSCDELGNRGHYTSAGPGVTSNCAMAENLHFYLSYSSRYNQIRGDYVPGVDMYPAPQSHQLLGNIFIDSYISTGLDCDLSSVVGLPNLPSDSLLHFVANTKYCYYVKTDTHYIVIGGSTKSTMDEGMTPDIAEFLQYNTNGYPFFTSLQTSPYVEENKSYVITVTATDPEGADILFSVSGGTDATSFSIDPSTGVLTFNTAPDYETKSLYIVEISAYDGFNTNTQRIVVRVTDVLEGPADITDPEPGSTLIGDSQSISLNNDGTTTGYQVQVGSAVGRNDYYDSGVLDHTATGHTLENLPTDASTVYVRVWYKTTEGTWEYKDHEFRAASGGGTTAPTIDSPASGTTLAAYGQAFSWSDTGASKYYLQIGSIKGSNDIHDSGPLDGTSTTVDYLPTDGSTVYVLVWSYNNGKWASQDQQFTADNSGGVTPPTISFLNTGETLTSSEQTFTWSDVGASDYWLQIGTSLGRNDIYDSGVLPSTEQPVFDLPTDGSPIYVR